MGIPFIFLLAFAKRQCISHRFSNKAKRGVKHLVRYLAEEDLDDIEAGNKYAG